MINHIKGRQAGPARLPNPCKTCGTLGHSSFSCHKRPKRSLHGKKRIRAIGKVGRQWIATRKEWIAKNLPDSGVWHCHYCGTELYLNTLTLDHLQSRGRHPELRFELSNLVPSCSICNVKKGSLSGHEYLKKLEKE